MRPIILLTACFLASACGVDASAPTVIDGSSAATFDQTLSAAKADLGPKDRLKFEAALSEFKARTFAKANSRQEYQELLRKGLNGLTAPRIVDHFNRDVDRVGGQAADAVFEAKRALGSGLVDHSQKMTVAARATAEKKTVGHRRSG